MGSNPVNLGLRFLLELFALAALGYWGWSLGGGFMRILLACVFPVVAMVIWVVFNVRNDPSRSGKAPVPVPGFVRLVIELAIFGTAGWGMFSVGSILVAAVLGGLVVIHYALSYDRVAWLIKE